MILVDDCSSDNQSIVEKFKKGCSNSLLKNKLICWALEIKLLISTGDIIAFLDSDDIWYPEKLSKHLGFMEIIHQYFLIHLMVLQMKMEKNKINISCKQ